MAVAFSVGERLVSLGDLQAATSMVDLPSMLAIGGDNEELRLPSGGLPLHEIRAARTPDQQPFEFIGVGKPLSIRIHTVYVGDIPSGKRKDLLVLSGLKAVQTLEAQPRMLNLMEKDVADYSVPDFSPFRSGTHLVYYTSALVDHDITVRVEAVADDFDSGTFNQVSNLFQMASGLPVFAPASAYLLAGSFLTRMTGRLLEAFRERGPFLADTQHMTFGVGGLPNFAAGLYVLSNGDPTAKFRGHTIQLNASGQLRLTQAGGAEYRGREPYVIVGVDGREEAPLDGFQGQVAQASLLEKYYPRNDRPTVILEEVEQALQLYNDFRYRRKAERLQAKVDALDAGDPRRDELGTLLAAYKKNIRTEEFQL